ncbi:signal peptidase I [Lihuaxuella thermophila]|uniref:Signal peptidase I n=1 Tax=Lihuaxuella thermophila TaxID=1173111 RepID=A0A1H8AEV5_9BACL|nr:signal peptidase I [Lihuaxuella thermophila]SEM68464.1 signal peptidase I [Lihuaxuella thermophila]
MVFSRKQILICVGILTGLVVLYMIWNSFYAFYQAEGKSMEPALKEHEIYLVDKTPETIQRGDIIVFRSPKHRYDFIKRVIALPNETIEIKDNRVYINGQLLHEPYLSRFPDIQDVGPVTVPDNHYYVLGDERVSSFDSRHMGAIPYEQIIGILQP